MSRCAFFIDNDIPFISQKSQSKMEGGLQQPIKLVKKISWGSKIKLSIFIKITFFLVILKYNAYF